jgi:hypothetical protein
MDKLQEAIERVFGDLEHKPASQPRSEAAVMRERAFAEGARKLEALRAARLAKAHSKASDSRRRKRNADVGS